MAEKYENVVLVKEEVEALKELEEDFGIPIPKIDKINWDDYKIDEITHQLEKVKQHQFGFIAEDQHVIALGFSLESLNVKSLKVPKKMPKISKFENLQALDVHKWEDFFSEYFLEVKKKEEIQQSLVNPQIDIIRYKTVAERTQARRDTSRAKMAELREPIYAPSPYDLFNELKKLENLTHLYLSQCNLTESSYYGSYIEGLKDLKNLQVLDLSKSKISVMPKEFESLETFHTLILSDNPVEKYPNMLDKVKSLKKLDLSDTNIKNLPESLGNHILLEELLLPIGVVNFPESFIDLKNLKVLVASNLPKNLKEFKKLKSFKLNNGKMEELPNSLAELNQLETLEISDCRSLKKIPENIGNLKSLKSLIITGNTSLKKLPSSIFNLSALQNLNLYNNSLNELPDLFGNFSRLEVLNLSNNQIIYIPYSVYKLNNLIDFTIENNPLEKNDKIISKKTLPEIKQYSKKKVSINVFISHAVADFEPYRIKELSEFLEAQLEINKSFYCERDLGGNIDEFMDENIPKSQLVLFVATPTSTDSKDCQYELKLAREYDVEIIPLKSTELDWSDLNKIGLSRELGIEFNFSDREKFAELCENLYDYIKQLKRQIDLHDKEKGKIDKLTIGLKLIERKIEKITETMETLDNRIKIIEEKVNK
ncbi:MAG: leucine-rich repeat domain-containing protein [Promethearchaeota archaeon]